MSSVCAFVADEVQSCFQPPAATLPVPPVLAVAVSNTLPADIQAEADPASSHLNVVDITPNTEAEPISSLLGVVDITPEERTLTMAVFATLPADIQAEDVAVVIRQVTKDVTLDVPCRARKGAVRQLFCRPWRAVCCCACHKEEEEQY
ncbi:uncharacterized protein ACWYII_041638 [Salvelinus alpinus]